MNDNVGWSRLIFVPWDYSVKLSSCAFRLCVYHVHRICSLSCFLSSLYLRALLHCQKSEWSIAMMEDGRLEEGHSPVIVVVGELTLFSITDGRPFIWCEYY